MAKEDKAMSAPPKRIFAGKSGFTLIEIIISLMLVGIMGAVVAMGFVKTTESFVFAQKNSAVVGKAQLAMSRLTKEFFLINAVSSGSSTSISYTRPNDAGADTTLTLSLVGDEVRIDSDVLVDGVQAFSLAYYDTYSGSSSSSWSATRKLIEISLTLQAAAGVNQEFKTRIALRNI